MCSDMASVQAELVRLVEALSAPLAALPHAAELLLPPDGGPGGDAPPPLAPNGGAAAPPLVPPGGARGAADGRGSARRTPRAGGASWMAWLAGRGGGGSRSHQHAHGAATTAQQALTGDGANDERRATARALSGVCGQEAAEQLHYAAALLLAHSAALEALSAETQRYAQVSFPCLPVEFMPNKKPPLPYRCVDP
jgi:hypothetical protein